MTDINVHYIVQATVTKKDRGRGYTTTRQVPTFYLNRNVQGIVSLDHARIVAESIIDPFGLYECSISVGEV
jgi:hypothetical protein